MSMKKGHYRQFTNSSVRTTIKDYDIHLYEGWNFNSGNYLFTTDTK